jgi:hypothetical protein
MCKQGQAMLGWWWLLASVPHRPTTGHPPGVNEKVKTGTAWWRRWRSSPPLSVEEAPSTDRFSGIAGEGSGSEAGEKCGDGGAQRGGRGRGGSQTQTQATGFTSRITESKRNHSSIEGRMPAAERLGLPDATVWAAERLGCTATAQTAA